jgi:hypothetical protein
VAYKNNSYFNNNNKGFLKNDIDTEMKQTLIEWHFQDPPDEFEIRRNNRIYLKQHNRNPFIDYPEWVMQFFEEVSVWPGVNIVSDGIKIDKVGVINSVNQNYNGCTVCLIQISDSSIIKEVLTNEKGEFTISDVSSGTYILSIKKFNSLIKKSNIFCVENGELCDNINFNHLILGDFNSDNKIDTSDINIFSINYENFPTYNLKYDLNMDGFVNSSDYILMMNNLNNIGD